MRTEPPVRELLQPTTILASFLGGVMTLVFVDGTLFSRGRLSEKKLRRTLQRAASVDGDQPTSRKAGAP
jgi:hypothetical protein